MIEVVRMFEEDPETKYIVVIGEIGGTMEERVAQYIGSGKGYETCGGVYSR
jgi:succinyl-CoA synthetase (ADP-forming) alpha subunit (EC 6.2.1.5)